MNVGELLELLQRVPQNATVVVPSGDHSYRVAFASYEMAEKDQEDNSLSELYDEIPVACRVPIVLIH
jgi:hypothetical protein